MAQFVAMFQSILAGQTETKAEFAELGECISTVEHGEHIPKQVLQTQPSAPKQAPPVSILKRSQPTAIPTPPPKAVVKDLLLHLLAVMDAHILSYFSAFYTDLFDEVFMFESLSLVMIRWSVMCCHHVHI